MYVSLAPDIWFDWATQLVADRPVPVSPYEYIIGAISCFLTDESPVATGDRLGALQLHKRMSRVSNAPNMSVISREKKMGNRH